MEQKYVWIAVLLALAYQLWKNDEHRRFIGELLVGNFDVLRGEQPGNGDQLFTVDELKKYDNDENGLYLAILGKVFDVTAGAKHYGPGQTYHHFTGKDASLAFFTGESTEKSLSDDVSSLTDSQLQSIKSWVKFYEENYIYKGKLIGRYYDKYGNPTEQYRDIEARIKLAEDKKREEAERAIMFPPCNVEWKADLGSRVWCTKQSGGITRDWAGVPRQYFEHPAAGQHRCACVNLDSQAYRENEAKIREYEDCPEKSESCIVKESTIKSQ